MKRFLYSKYTKFVAAVIFVVCIVSGTLLATTRINFILTNETAKKLYHDYAEKMPIIDYHCHINPKEIYENKKFKKVKFFY